MISTEEPYTPPNNGGGNGDDPLGNGSNGDDGNGDEPDDPINNETEEPSENNTDNDVCNLYNLTVEVVNNATGPISNASITIYDNNETKITKSYTNETGEAKFLLEKGIYIIEIEKDKHSSSYHTVNLLASMEYTTYMSSQNENSSSTPCNTCQQKDGFPVIYIIGVIVIVAVVAIIFFYRRRST